MFRKILTILFTVLLTVWSTFAIFSIVESSVEKSYLSYFNAEEDELIIAIHHPSDFEIEQLEVDCNQKNIDVFLSIYPKIKDLSSVFLSKKRNIIVIQTHDKWSISRVKKTFDHGIYSFELKGPNSFQFGRYIGTFKGNELILYYYDIELNETASFTPWDIDPQATYSIVYLFDPLHKTRDVYIKSEYKISYTNSDFKTQKSKLVDDLSLFGNLIPKEIRTYTFFEKSYLKEVDSRFKSSPLVKLVKTGVIIIQVDKSPILIFDMNQDIELSAYLNDFFHVQENNQERGRFTNFPVCDSFNETLEADDVIKAKEVIAYSLDGYGFLTSDESALDAVLLELEMRKSLNTAEDNIPLFQAPLPKTVSQRYLDTRNSNSLSWVGKKLVQTNVEKLDAQKSTQSLEETKNYFTMNPGLPVISFCALSGRGNVIMEVDKELIGYKNGSLKWRKELPESLLNPPAPLSSQHAENEYILLPFSGHLEIIDKMGRQQYEIKGSFTGKPIQCTINKQPAFGIQAKDGIYCYAASSGKLLKRFILNEKVAEWNIIEKSGKITLGIKTDNQVLFIDYASGKRQTNKVNIADFISFTSAGFIQRGTNGMQELIGSKIINIQVPTYWKYSGEIKLEEEIGQLFHDGKTIVLVVKGKVKWKKSIAHSEVSELIVSQETPTLFVVRDALENKVFLWDYQGNSLDQEERPGQRTIQLTSFGTRGASVTTYLNNFIIQFNY